MRRLFSCASFMRIVVGDGLAFDLRHCPRLYVLSVDRPALKALRQVHTDSYAARRNNCSIFPTVQTIQTALIVGARLHCDVRPDAAKAERTEVGGLKTRIREDCKVTKRVPHGLFSSFPCQSTNSVSRCWTYILGIVCPNFRHEFVQFWYIWHFQCRATYDGADIVLLSASGSNSVNSRTRIGLTPGVNSVVVPRSSI